MSHNKKHRYRSWTPADKAKFKEMYEAGNSLKQMSQVLDRTENALRKARVHMMEEETGIRYRVPKGEAEYHTDEHERELKARLALWAANDTDLPRKVQYVSYMLGHALTRRMRKQEV